MLDPALLEGLSIFDLRPGSLPYAPCPSSRPFVAAFIAAEALEDRRKALRLKVRVGCSSPFPST